MKISLTDEHKKHLKLIGHTCPPKKLVVGADEFAEAVDAWKATGVPAEELEKRAVAHIAWEREKKRMRRERRGQKSSDRPSFFRRYWHTALLVLILFSLVPYVHCQYDGPVLPLDASGNVVVNCILGCSATAGFTDNSAFTVGSTTINPLGAYYTNGAAPSITTGNAGRIRMDASSILLVDCSVGCSGSSFADNSAFTAGTTPLSISAGWYSTSPTNCTSGNGCAPQLTIDRKLFVQSFQGTSPWVDNITQWNSVALGSPSAYGTSPGAVNVPGVNAFITNTPTVTANAGTNLNTSALALDTSVNGVLLSQGSTTSGQKGPLVQGAVTTGSPTYTTAQTSPLSLTTGGALRVDGSGSTQPVSGTIAVTQGTGTNLHMVCDSGCSSSTAPADGSAFTENTTSFSPVGGYFRTSPTSLTTDHMGVVGMTASRHLFVNLPDALPAGTNVIGHVIADSGSTTVVTGTVAVSAASLPLPTGAAADSSLTTLDTDVKSNVTLHAGTNLIGKAGFDNTTPGTTNGVSMAQPTRTTGTITTSSTSIPVTSTGYGVATVTVNGTYAGITVNFEFSDDGGTTYYSDTCTRTDTNVQESSEALPSNQSRAWDCGVFAATNFRVRSSAFTSGTANIGITLSAAPIEPAPTVSINGTVPVSAASLPLPSGAATSANQCGSSTPCEVSATTSANGATNPIYTRETDGTNPVILDPCRTQANIFKPISQTASAQLVTGTSAKKIYICSINLVTAAANNVAMVEGTGTVCATGIAGMAGGTTAATGWNFAANGGLTQGNGMGSIMAEATNADNLCLLQSAAVQLSGSIGYVVQ